MQPFKVFMRNYIWAFLLFFAVLVFLLLMWMDRYPEFKASEFWVASGALLTALMTGLVITLAEKVGWLSNYKQEMKSLESKINELPTSIQERLVFGLRSVEEDFNEVAFLSDQEGDEICWLNTYFRLFEIKVKLIEDAIQKGTKIRLLFMDPESKTAAEKAYYSASRIDPESVSHNVNSYRQRLKANVYNCISMIEEMKQIYGDDAEKLLEIKFYSDSPNLPIVILSKRDSLIGEDQFKPFIAASGFYLDLYSSQLPYITWDIKDGGQKAPLVNNLYAYFNRKWGAEGTRSLQDLRESGSYDNWEQAAITNLPPISQPERPVHSTKVAG